VMLRAIISLWLHLRPAKSMFTKDQKARFREMEIICTRRLVAREQAADAP